MVHSFFNFLVVNRYRVTAAGGSRITFTVSFT
jgi:hypothetical protein